MDKEKITIPLKGNKIAVLTIHSFNGEIDVEQLVQIDYANLMGEILTFPVVFNRIANLRAEANNLLGRSKFDMEVFEAQLYEEYRKSLSTRMEKKPTREDIKSSVVMDSRYRLKQYEVIENQKYFDYCDALYWSAQSKDTKLNRLIERMRPEEFENEILEETINGISIKIKRTVI